MKKEIIKKLNKSFEEAAYQEDGLEYWLARELQELLGYSDWRNFSRVINKAKESCKNAEIEPNYHFVDVNKTIKMPKGASKKISDIMLTRYACYLIAQNGDPKKEQIAFAQSYFALQTRKQELLEERIELLTTDEWQNAISNAVKQQQRLEKIAKEEESISGEYIRQIVLFQAQHDSQNASTINVEEVKKFLVNTMHLSLEQIAVATGKEREIEGKDLSAVNEPIRFIITKQALKEGWDCPFAYVFCSVAKVRSSKDVEQLLGRILRMPNVKRKERAELNRAYAFVSSDSFYNTAKKLQDSLISAGFTSAEASDLIEVAKDQYTLGKFFRNIQAEVSNVPDFSNIDSSLKDKIVFDIETKSITIKKEITEEEKEVIKSTLSSNKGKAKIEKVYQEIKSLKRQSFSPQKQGKIFAVHQLLIDFDGKYRVFHEEVLLPPNWNFANCDKTLSDDEFPTKVDSGTKGLIDVASKGNSYTYNASKIQEELSSLIVSCTMDKNGFIQWLVKECRHQSIPYAQVIVFVSSIVDELIENRYLHIEHLVYMRLCPMQENTKKDIMKKNYLIFIQKFIEVSLQYE